MVNTYVIIMAGGKGERFWPLSTKDHPKQLLPVGTKRTMIEESVERIKPLVSPEKILIVTNKNLKSKIEKLVPEIPAKNVIGEPVGRNTAPAIGLGAVIAQAEDEDPIIVVLTADHIIKEEEKFLNVLKRGIEIAGEGRIVTIGIKPDHPETGYGHIKPAEKVSEENDIEVFKVEKFVEKPNMEKANEYTKNGYLWNSGMFIFKASIMLDAMAKYMPSLYEGLIKTKESLSTDGEEQTIKEIYESLEGESIDYGVMEKAKNAYVIKGDFKWNDVGSWSALDDIYPKDGNGNVKIGETLGIDTKNSILVGDKRLIASIGVENLVIVETDDAVLVCHKNEAQKVKDLVKKIKE